MRFACQSCGKAYNLPEEKIAEKNNVKLKCRVCGAIVEVKRQGEIVAQLLAPGKRVGRISEAPAPLTSFAPGGDTMDHSNDLIDNDEPGIPVAPLAPSFNLTGSTNLAAPPDPIATAVRSAPRFEAPSPSNEPPLPAWARPGEPAPPPPLERPEDRARFAAPPAPSPPPVLSPPPPVINPAPPMMNPVPPVLSPPPVLPRIAQEPVSNGVSEHSNGRSTMLRAVDHVSNGAALPFPDVAPPLTNATDRFAVPVVPPVSESASDVNKKMMAAFITGLIIGFILARLLQ